MRYRITKYDPARRDAQGFYPPDEWTSCSDIGRVYGGHKLTAEEYLAVERAYTEAIRIVAEQNGCTSFRVRQLERLYSVWETSREMKRLGLPLTEQELELYRSVELSSVYGRDEVCTLAVLILRELLWATLYAAQGNTSFTFGYDYYLYADCPPLTQDAVRQIEACGLFVEPMPPEETL